MSGSNLVELIALTDGYREPTESWADLLRDCKRRGMRAPVLAVGDGALGFWGALREVFPQARDASHRRGPRRELLIDPVATPTHAVSHRVNYVQ